MSKPITKEERALVAARCKDGVQADCDWIEKHGTALEKRKAKIQKHKQRVEALKKKRAKLDKKKNPTEKWKKEHKEKTDAQCKRIDSGCSPDTQDCGELKSGGVCMDGKSYCADVPNFNRDDVKKSRHSLWHWDTDGYGRWGCCAEFSVVNWCGQEFVYPPISDAHQTNFLGKLVDYWRYGHITFHKSKTSAVNNPPWPYFTGAGPGETSPAYYQDLELAKCGAISLHNTNEPAGFGGGWEESTQHVYKTTADGDGSSIWDTDSAPDCPEACLAPSSDPENDCYCCKITREVP